LENRIGAFEQYHLIRSAIPIGEFTASRENKAQVRLELGIPEGVHVIGNVGRFSPQKNPLDWIRVAKGVSDRFPDCWFLLVGNGPMRDEVETLASRSGLTDRLVFTGLRRDVPMLIGAMDIFLLTSLWEGLPRVIPQAFAMEIPVIANKADGTQEIIEHGETGYLCNPDNIKEMVGYCIHLLENPISRKNMGKQGRLVVQEEFNLNVMIKKIETLYEDFIISIKL